MIELPRVGPVGLTEIPEDYVRTPRQHGPWMRAFCLVLVGAFVTTMLWTGVESLARYCLTSHAGFPFPGVP